MPNLNHCTLIGTLTRDPELKYTPKGTAIASFSLAINRTWKTEGGEKREEVSFIDCEAYGKQADIIGEYVKKGHPFCVLGRLKQDTWEDKQTQQKRSKIKVVVEDFQFLAPANRGGGTTAPDPADPGRPPADEAQPDDIPF